MNRRLLAKKQFVKWVQKHDPIIYRAALKRMAMRGRGLGDMGAIDWGGIFSNIGTVAQEVVKVAPDIYAAKQQKELMDMQMKRAERGLPPANIEDYTPVIKYAPQITPESEAAATRIAQSSINTTFEQLKMPLLLLGGGFLALKAMKKI